jgi:DNA polymerase
MDLRELADIVNEATAPDMWDRCRRQYKTAEHKFDLGEREWTAVKVVVTSWRDAHPAIVQSWWSMQDAAIDAVSSPGRIVDVLGGRIRYMVARGFLFCSLPSGRCLAYYHPYIRTTKVKRKDANGEEYEVIKREVCYSGYESSKNRWVDNFQLYGGLQCENNVQAIARDVLVEGMFGAEERGYKIVLTVHDELLTETPLGGDYSPEDLQKIMATVPAWCQGLPLAAKTWRGMRYDK